MEANTKVRQVCLSLAIGCMASLVGWTAEAANFRTQNFLIQAPDAALARAVGEAAERYRHELAVHWLGGPLQNWPTPCPVRVVAGANLPAQGVTTYNPRPVSDFQMEVVGTPERILDSVLPHEVSHTVLATHFGRPLPRWADEGICTTVEHASERAKHEAKLREFLRTRRGIAMNQLFLLTEYPSDVLPMYAQGYSVCRFLIEQKDPQTFIAFLQDYMNSPSWTKSVKKHYDYDSLAELQQYWLEWVSSGSGPVGNFVKTAPARPGMAGPAAVDLASNVPSPLALSSPLTAPNATMDPSPAMGPASASIALASASSAISSADGWYQRRRSEARANSPVLAAAPTLANPMVPPSVRNSGRYKSAQPQPEQQISRGGQVVDDITTWADGSPRYR